MARKSTAVTITQDGTDIHLLQTEEGASGVSVIVELSGNLGGGTLTVTARPDKTTGTAEIVHTCALGDQQVIWLGGDMDVFYTMSGSTTPNVTLYVSQV